MTAPARPISPGSPASRSTATSSVAGRDPAQPMQVVRTRADLRAALAGAPRPDRARAHDGLAPRGPRLAGGAGARRERDRRHVDLRQPAPVRGDRRLQPSTRATRRATSRSAEAAGVDLVFAPTVDEVYPPGFDTVVTVGAIADPLEGAARPGHFDGVATVVAILFALVGAERAYFGLKDYQQVQVIRRMALDLALPTEVVPCATVREAGRAGAVVAQRAADAGGPGGRPGPPPGAPRRRGAGARGRAVGRRRARRHARGARHGAGGDRGLRVGGGPGHPRGAGRRRRPRPAVARGPHRRRSASSTTSGSRSRRNRRAAIGEPPHDRPPHDTAPSAARGGADRVHRVDPARLGDLAGQDRAPDRARSRSWCWRTAPGPSPGAGPGPAWPRRPWCPTSISANENPLRAVTAMKRGRRDRHPPQEGP